MKSEERVRNSSRMDGGGRRRGPTAEDHALDQIAKEVSFFHYLDYKSFFFLYNFLLAKIK